MSDEWTYERTLDQMIQAFRMFKVTGPVMLPSAEADRAAKTIERSDSVGAIFYPSEWMAGRESLERQKKVVALYQHVCRELEEIFPADAEVMARLE